jgi:hypothetical protein
MRKLAMIVAASAAMAVAGCSTLGKAVFQQPIVNLKNVQIRGVGLTGGSLDVVLSVYNPNHYRLDATRSRFSVNDNDSTTVTIPVSFTYAGLGAAGRSILNTGAVNYHVLGDVTVGSPVGNFTVPYSSVGRFTTTGIGR